MSRFRGRLLLRTVALTGRRFPLYAASLVIWGVIVAFCFNLVIALVFQDVMNASTGGDASLLLRAVALALGTFLLGLPVWCLAQYGLSFALYRSKTDLRGRLFERVVGIPLAKIEGVHSGDVISRCTNTWTRRSRCWANVRTSRLRYSCSSSDSGSSSASPGSSAWPVS